GRAVRSARSTNPHAVEESDDGRGTLGEVAQGLASAVLDRLRTGESARRQVFHKVEKERQIRGGDALLIQRQNKVAAARMEQKIGVLDALGDPLIGQQIADVVVRKEFLQVLRDNVGIDRHRASYSAASLPRSGRGNGKNISSSAAVTVSMSRA